MAKENNQSGGTQNTTSPKGSGTSEPQPLNEGNKPGIGTQTIEKSLRK